METIISFLQKGVKMVGLNFDGIIRRLENAKIETKKERKENFRKFIKRKTRKRGVRK